MPKLLVQIFREFVVDCEDYATAEQIVREQFDDVLKAEGTRAMNFEYMEQCVDGEEADFVQTKPLSI
jgi:hypothetical protein